MRYLIVVAHPDDEVLGCGGTIRRLTSDGHQVDVCILSGDAAARTHRPSDAELRADEKACMDALGVDRVYRGTFPNIQFNTVPHLSLVQFIEACILEYKPNAIITHHPADTNNDHVHTALAAQAALRLFQRRTDVAPIDALYYMEIPSATDWSVDHAQHPFRPDTFFEIGEEGLEVKLRALAMYRGVMRPFPHPRSNEAIRGLAALRGGQAGMYYAEAFETAFRRGL